MKAGAKVDAQDDSQRTPLHHAAQFNTSADMIRVLVKCGADVNACDNRHWTSLHKAAVINREVVPVLVQHGAKVNMLNSGNHSPIHWAARGLYDIKAHKEAVKALLDAGADPTLGDDPPLDDKKVEDEMKTLIRKHLSLY